MLAVVGILFTELFGIAQPWWELGNKVGFILFSTQSSTSANISFRVKLRTGKPHSSHSISWQTVYAALLQLFILSADAAM